MKDGQIASDKKERIFDYKIDSFSVGDRENLLKHLNSKNGQIVVLVIENIIYLRTRSYEHTAILNDAKKRHPKTPIDREDFSRTAASVFKKNKDNYIIDFSVVSDDFKDDYDEDVVKFKIMDFFDLHT